MKNRAKTALALALAIVGAVAAPLRSDARSGSYNCGESRQPLAKQAFRGACPQIFRATFADFVAVADAMVISGEVKLYKPMREIYDLLRERIGLPAEALCFFDDVEANCAGARAAGWHAIRFATNDQAAADFEALLG